MSLKLFGYKSVSEKISQEKEWMKNNFVDCPIKYEPEAAWRDNAMICRLSLLKPYCDAYGIYQILNKEFNDALAAEIKQMRLSPVLEVGAGLGYLSNALQKRGIDVTAVDNFSDPLLEKSFNKSAIISQKMDYREALDKFNPQLVICSWMPPGEDWTIDIKNTDSVKAYILIGEEDQTIWGEFTGWRSKVLKESNKWSLCRLDHGVDFEKPELWWRHSKVILYKRLNK